MGDYEIEELRREVRKIRKLMSSLCKLIISNGNISKDMLNGIQNWTQGTTNEMIKMSDRQDNLAVVVARLEDAVNRATLRIDILASPPTDGGPIDIGPLDPQT